MKALIFSALMATSAVAFAEPVNPRDHACTDLQEMLVAAGSLQVQGLFGYDTHFSTPSCPEDYWANYAYVFAADKTFCGLGYVCQYNGKGQ